MSYGETGLDHVLVVHRRGDDGFEIEHPSDCPVREEPSPVGSIRWYTCAVADHVDMFCLNAFQDLEPGRYELGAWWSMDPGGPWGPTEWDGGLNIGDRLTPYPTPPSEPLTPGGDGAT